MARGIKVITLVGNVGKAPESRFLQDGTHVASFTLAVNEKARGSQEETTTWFKISAWRGAADVASKYVQKGQRLTIIGPLSTSEYTDREGVKRFTLEVQADHLDLGSKGDGQEGQQRQQGGPAFGDDLDADQVPF